MKVLCIGDVVSRIGRDMLFQYVEDLKYSKNIDFVIVNGENAAHGNGLTRKTYDELVRSGCDVITLGNHTWGAKDIFDLLNTEVNIIRPANFNKLCPGEGSVIITAKNGLKVGVINLIGRTYMDPVDSPFDKAIEEIEKIKKVTNIIFVDFHAEATSEKQALGFYLDGKVSAIFGTHTHIQTADDTILPLGSGYITDLGMTGPQISVLGTDKDIIINRFLTGLPQKFQLAEGKGQFCGCIFEIDETTGLCNSTERLFIKEK